MSTFKGLPEGGGRGQPFLGELSLPRIKADLARTGGGASRADGDRGASRRAGAPAENRFGDRRGSDGPPLDRLGGEAQEFGCRRQRSPRVSGGGVRRLGHESYGLRYGQPEAVLHGSGIMTPDILRREWTVATG